MYMLNRPPHIFNQLFQNGNYKRVEFKKKYSRAERCPIYITQLNVYYIKRSVSLKRDIRKSGFSTEKVFNV